MTPSPPAPRLTGERTVPGVAEENYWFRRHEAAYHLVLPQCVDAVVLEAGCGEGYGAALIGTVARTVLALDCDRSSAVHAARRYPGLAVVQANLVALPVPDGRIDVLDGLQVIEHLWDQARFLAECARVLRPGGAVVLSTPNRLTFSPADAKPLNPFHTRELSAGELVDALPDDLVLETMLGLHHGSRLEQLDLRYGGVVAAQLAGPAEGWPESLRADVASISAADFLVRRDDLDRSLDLVLVAVRR